MNGLHNTGKVSKTEGKLLNDLPEMPTWWFSTKKLFRLYWYLSRWFNLIWKHGDALIASKAFRRNIDFVKVTAFTMTIALPFCFYDPYLHAQAENHYFLQQETLKAVFHPFVSGMCGKARSPSIFWVCGVEGESTSFPSKVRVDFFRCTHLLTF